MADDHATVARWVEDKLILLGDPAPNPPKWFAAVEVIQLD